MEAFDKADSGLTATRLLEAIKQNDFVLFGQFIIPISAPQDPSGYIEVLIRYAEEEKRLLPPGGFFDVLEKLNLMSLLDRWVINRVIGSFLKQSPPAKVPRYSINLSVDSLYEHEFVNLMREYFRKYQLPPNRLRFELDENDAHVHVDEYGKLASALNPLGCGFTITSYTGELLPPAELHSLGVDCVKMNGKDLTEASVTTSDRIGKNLIYAMCKERGLQVIADMIEERQVLDRLKALGVDYAQGYAIARPAPLTSLQKALNRPSSGNVGV